MDKEEQDYTEAIKQLETALNRCMKKSYLWNDNDLMIDMFTNYYACIYNQIHKVLAKQPSVENEKQIRNILTECVIGFKRQTDTKAHIGAIEMLENKIRQLLNGDREKNMDIIGKYNKLYDDFYALAAFRSMQHFAVYMEWDLEKEKRIFNNTLNCFGGYWHYATQAILDFKWKKLFTQAPTGYGKSYKDTVTIAFIFGYDLQADILKVSGNPANIASNSGRLVKYMCTPRYAKVFPYFAQFKGQRDKMFDVCQMGGTEKPTRLLLHGSEKGESLLFCNKLTPIDGNRYKYKFYDDITRSKDKSNISMHEKDCEMYKSEWERRKYDDFHNLEFFSGTAYHNEDFICTTKRKNGADWSIKSPINKYTKINPKTQAVFVAVPKLDPDTDKITFPQMFSEYEAKKKRDEDPREFYAMDQQEPMPMEGCPFDYKNIMTYASIPHKEGVEEFTYAALDPARTGANYVAMVIFIKIEGKFYLKDVVFEMRAIEDLHNEIVEKIIKHRVTQILIERNTDTSLKTLLEKLCLGRGYSSCKFMEIYTTKNKEDKIANAEASIRNNLVFPEFNLYGTGSQMRNFMKYFTGYSYLTHNKYDDAPDVVAMFTDKFVKGQVSNRKAYCIEL